MNDKEKDYQLLLDKVNEVFGDDIDRLTETQEAIVNRLIERWPSCVIGSKGFERHSCQRTG